MNESTDDDNLDVLIHTSIADPIGIGLAESLVQEAGIPFFVMDQNVTARQKSGNFLGIWNIRVPRDFETDAREILRSVEDSK